MRRAGEGRERPALFTEGYAERGKTILKSALVLAAVCVFSYLYSLIREPFTNTRHEALDMQEIHLLFTYMLLLLMGMPILR